jgi:hypothetical protein
MKEYGTNVQKLVDHILTIQDRNKRTRYAYLLVDLMKQVHPNMRDNQDYSNKLWDDLYIMSNFQLDVDSPFPPPSPDAVGKHPKRMPYPRIDLQFKHYGRNLELLIKRAVTMPDSELKRELVAHIGKLMKTFYITWNKEVVEDSVIWENLRELSKGELADTIELVANGQLSSNYRNNNRNNNNHYSRSNNNNNQNRNNNNRGNNHQNRNNNHNNNNNNRRRSS